MNPAIDVSKIDPAQTHQAGEFKYQAPLLTCRFDPSGQHVFATSEDFSIQRWNLADGKVTPLAGHQSWVWSLAFHPSGSTLYSGGYDGRLIFWDASAERQRQRARSRPTTAGCGQSPSAPTATCWPPPGTTTW